MKDALQALADTFATLGTRWCVLGAQAVNVHGRPRMTADIDVTVDLGERPTSDLIEALARHEFLPAFALDDEFLSATRVVPVVHASAMPVDIMLAGPGLEELFLSRAEPVAVAGLFVPVISPEHLLVSKILAGRDQDIEDARGVLAATAEIDGDEVVSLLRALESALGEGDLVPRWEKLLD